ncbi:hypothetical protein [Actinoplanes subtropicus]|uniref:hypothetical protein n=1 Tax=Actinoplanes subtropicus TaxID=543632 RepID=UPI0004C2E056|nr:hypothetical protein [Actinoplanes subtropicus]
MTDWALVTAVSEGRVKTAWPVDPAELHATLLRLTREHSYGARGRRMPGLGNRTDQLRRHRQGHVYVGPGSWRKPAAKAPSVSRSRGW